MIIKDEETEVEVQTDNFRPTDLLRTDRRLAKQIRNEETSIRYYPRSISTPIQKYEI